MWPIAFGIGGACTAIAALWVSVMSNRRNVKQDVADSLEARLTNAEARLLLCETARTRFERLYYELLAEIHERKP